MCPRSARVNTPSHFLSARVMVVRIAGLARRPFALFITFTSCIGPSRSSAARCVSMLLYAAPVSMRAFTDFSSSSPCTVTFSTSPIMIFSVMLCLQPVLVYKRARSAVIESMVSSAAGPIAAHVTVPGATTVFPASVIVAVGSVASLAACTCLCRLFSSGTLSTIFAIPVLLHSL